MLHIVVILVVLAAVVLTGFYPAVKKWPFWTSPTTQTIITFVFVFIGVVGALYTEEMRTAFNSLLELGNVNFSATLFWTVFAGSLWFYFLSQKAVQEKETQRVKELQDLINSVPPKDFLQIYSDNCTESFLALRGIEEVKDRTMYQVELGIQSILRLIISTVRCYWWETSPDIEYAANIMIAEPATKKSKIDFAPPAFDPEQLKCVLKIYKNLSATSVDKKGPDKNLPEILLPVYQDTDRRVIPGAPDAFERGGHIPVSDTREQKWLEGASRFDESVKKQIRDYFDTGEGKSIKSFVSIPLVNFLDETPFAVLNIHSNRVGPWKNEKSSLQLVHLISPFMDHLMALLTIWKEKNKKQFLTK
jgi:hypothetical protein